MSLIGLRCLFVDKANGIHATVIRAASTPLQRSSDFTNTRVLLEYVESSRPHTEWVTLPSMASRFTAVFIEDQLVWARRLLPSESNSLAWPAKAYSLLFGGLSNTTIMVEYFCDQERTYLELSDTKQLNIIEAKKTLAQHSQMINELKDSEKRQRDRELLFSGHHNLCHYHVSTFNTQQVSPSWSHGTVTEHNTRTKELTIVEDTTRMIRTVNPLLVEVQISNKTNQQQGMVSSTTSGWYTSPVNSPRLQHHQYYGSNTSLTNMNPLLMQSDPNINHPQQQQQQQYDGCTDGYSTPSGSYTNIHQLPIHEPTAPSNYLEPLRRNERSASLGNLHLLAQTNERNGCGHIMKRADEKEHEEDTCTKRPIELQLVTVQCHMKRMFTEMKKTFEKEMEEMKVMIVTQNEEIEKLKEEIEKLKKEKEPQFTTTIPVFSSSILCLMPKLPSGNIPGVSYFPGDRFVKIAASCEQELEAHTNLFLAEYEKILPRLSKEEFKVNEHFPADSLKSFVDVCNKKFTACYVSYKHLPTPTIELVSNNTSQFEIAKKMISEKMKHKIYRMGFPGSTTHTLTLKCGNIKEEVIDVIVLFVGNSAAESPAVSSGSLTSFFRLSYSDSFVKPVLLPTVPPGKAILVREPKHCAKNVIYISSLSLQTIHGYFGKEAYSTVSESVKEAFKEAIGIEAKSIAFPCEATSGGGMQSNYIIPAVIEVVSQLISNKTDDSVKDDSPLSDIRILIQDNNMDDAQLSFYFKYLALKYHLQ